MALTLVTPPAAEPITLAQFKLHARITRDDEDASLLGYIAAARQYAEARQRRQLITATYELALDTFYDCQGDGTICLPRPPLQAVTEIEYIDHEGQTQTLDASDYLVDIRSEPGRLMPAYGLVWPSLRTQANAVTITFTAGYGSLPSDVPWTTRQAILLLASHYYENREAVALGTIATAVPIAVDALLAAESFGGYV